MSVAERYSFSRFVYFNTNIISHTAKNPHLWGPLLGFLEQHDLTLGVSSAQIAELCDAERLHGDIVMLLMNVPSGVLKEADVILDEEVIAHPSERKDSLLFFALNALLLEEDGVGQLQSFLSSRALRTARAGQLEHARRMGGRHAELKDNFRPTPTGKYTRQQADVFAQRLVKQWHDSSHPDFAISLETRSEQCQPQVFLSVRLFAHVVFYKYYLGQRVPKRTSDFGDLAHLAYIPYCELAVMERDMCNVLNQIKRHQDVLKSTVVRNIDFLADWSWC